MMMVLVNILFFSNFFSPHTVTIFNSGEDRICRGFVV